MCKPTFPHAPDVSNAVAATFWSRVEISADPEACWLYDGPLSRPGYPRMRGRFEGRAVQVLGHRFSYYVTTGVWPLPLALHRCDVRRCVNPRHIYPGTSDDNMRDMVERGRNPRGDMHPLRLHPEKVARGERVTLAKLTAADIIAIRAMRAEGWLIPQLSDHFAVGMSQIHRIIHRESWRHIP